jgi:5-methyltetrahydrofolate--homocysteine methyltransferase
MAQLDALAKAVVDGDQDKAVELTKAALADGTPVKTILDEGLIGGMNTVAELWKNSEIYIPEVLIAARAMKSAMEILEPELVKAGVEPAGKCVMGTVQGDLHDIGKNLVVMMLKGAGFDVVDLGVDVSPDKFVEHAKTSGAQIVGMSSLLTTTMPSMEKTIAALKAGGVSVKVIIGGAPVTAGYAQRIGADGFAPDAASAVDMVKGLVA